MAELNDPVETGMPRNVRFGLIAVVFIIVLIWLLPRKVADNGGPAGGPTSAEKPGTTAEEVSDRETERRLNAILTGLSPEFVALRSNRLDRVAELGQWAADSLDSGDAAKIKLDAKAQEKWLQGAALAEVNDPSFSLRDGHHLTMTALAGDVVTKLSQQTADPLEQITELFDYVIRETLLAPPAYDTAFPGTPFESLLTGRATAEGRAWALALLLRQLRIDAVIIEPKSKPEAWLLGAIDPAGGVLLFDPRIGVSIPKNAGSAGDSLPATLAEVKQKPELLRLLDTEKFPYPIQVEDLNSINVKLISDSSTASERMARLQVAIAGRLMVVFDGLIANPLREKGLADRVIAAGSQGLWTAADVSVWDYPERQSEAFMSSGAEESRAWEPITKIFAGPITLSTVRKQTRNEGEASTETVVQQLDYPLRRVRVLHLQGNIEEALRRYGPIRQAARNLMMTRNPELQEKLIAAMPLNQRAADFACFWTAACQCLLKPVNTDQTLRAYTTDFPQGEMLPAVPELWATSFVKSGRKDDAIALLEAGRERWTPRLALLVKRWKGEPQPAGESQPAPMPEKPAEPASQPAPSPAPEATATETPGSDEPPPPPTSTPS